MLTFVCFADNGGDSGLGVLGFAAGQVPHALGESGALPKREKYEFIDAEYAAAGNAPGTLPRSRRSASGCAYQNRDATTGCHARPQGGGSLTPILWGCQYLPTRFELGVSLTV
jgi:hypothetical protein